MSILDQFRLDGQVGLVTGAGSGLGRAIALALASVGAAVGCLDRSSSAANATVDLIQSNGGVATAITADVSDSGQVEAAVATARATLGPISILFNNAGVRSSGLRLHELPETEWRERLAINLDGVYHVSKAVLPGMIDQKYGRIINTASIWGRFGSRSYPITEYAAAKGAVINLTREMALQYATNGILVNAIAPGFFQTNLSTDYSLPKHVEALSQSVPLGRCAEPEEIGGLALFLASRAAGYVTGQTFFIDGGFSIY